MVIAAILGNGWGTVLVAFLVVLVLRAAVEFKRRNDRDDAA